MLRISNTLTTSYRFGLAFSTRPTGFGMDIDRVLHIKTDKDNSRANQTAFNLAIGPRYSANEHLVPEQLFDNPKTKEKEVEGVSAVKAIQLAAQQGQTIYTFTKDKQAKILPKLTAHSSETLTDIRNGLNAGKQITISEKPIQFHQWNGTGYIVLDPSTNAGAYMIDGGKNGGFVFSLLGKFGLVGHSIFNTIMPTDKGKWWGKKLFNFSKGTTWLQTLKNVAYGLASILFLYNTTSTVANSNLSIRNKIGRILVDLVSSYAVLKIVAAAGLGLPGLVVGVFFMLFIAILANIVKTVEFGVRSRRHSKLLPSTRIYNV